MTFAHNDTALICFDLISDESALAARACAIARANQMKVRALHVLDDRALSAEATRRKSDPETTRAELSARAQARIGELIGEYAEGLEVRVEVRVGHPLSEIVTEAESCALVLTGADHNRRFSDRLFGGTCSQLLRAASAPVLVVNSELAGPFDRVLVSLALYDSAVDRELLTMAQEAAAPGAKLHVLHVTEDWMPFASSPAEKAEAAAEVVAAQRARLDELLASCELQGLPDAQRHVIAGDPRHKVREVAKQIDAKLVTIGTVARTGLARLIVGNTAEMLMSQLECSLLAIPPKR